jgi:WD40 repeat protein
MSVPNFRETALMLGLTLLLCSQVAQAQAERHFAISTCMQPPTTLSSTLIGEFDELAISDNGDWLAFMRDDALFVIKTTGDQKIMQSDATDLASILAVTDAGLVLADKYEGSSTLIDPATGKARPLPEEWSDGWVGLTAEGREAVILTEDAAQRPWIERRSLRSEALIQRDPLPEEFAGDAYISSDGRWLVANLEARVIVSRIDSLKNVATIAVKAEPREVAISPDGSRIAIVTRSSDRKWELSLHELSGKQVIGNWKDVLDAPVFSRDGRYLAFADSDGVRLVDLSSGRDEVYWAGMLFEGEELRLSPDGQIAMVPGFDGQGTALFLLSRDAGFLGCVRSAESPPEGGFRPDGGVFVVADGRLSSLSDHVAARALLPGDARLTSVSSFGAGRSLIVRGGEDGIVVANNLETGDHRQLVLSGKRDVSALAVSPTDDAVLIAADDLIDLSLWNPTSGALRTLEGPEDGTSFLAASEASYAAGSLFEVLVWRKDQLDQGRRLPKDFSDLQDLALSPDGGTLLTRDAQAGVQLWDATHAEEIASLQGHAGAITAAVFLPDGSLVTGGADGGIRFWSADGSPQGKLDLKHGAVFSFSLAAASGQLAAGTADETLVLIDPRTRQLLREFKTIGNFVMVDADAQYAFVASHDNRMIDTLRPTDLVEVQTGKSVHVFEYPPIVTQIAFLQSGRRLVTSGYAGEAVIWELTATASMPQSGRQ